MEQPSHKTSKRCYATAHQALTITPNANAVVASLPQQSSQREHYIYATATSDHDKVEECLGVLAWTMEDKILGHSLLMEMGKTQLKSMEQPIYTSRACGPLGPTRPLIKYSIP